MHSVDLPIMVFYQEKVKEVGENFILRVQQKKKLNKKLQYDDMKTFRGFKLKVAV